MSAMHSPQFHKKEEPGAEYIFVQGVGFLKMSPQQQERTSLRHASLVIGLALAVCLFCMMLLPSFFAKVLFGKASLQSYESNRFFLQAAGALGYLASLIVPVAIIRLFCCLPPGLCVPAPKAGLQNAAYGGVLCAGAVGNRRTGFANGFADICVFWLCTSGAAGYSA